MDFVDWSSRVLSVLIDLSRKSVQARSIGVTDTELGQAIFGSLASQPSFWESKEREAVVDALQRMERLGLVSERHSRYWQATELGHECIDDMIPLWEQICQTKLQPDQEQLLRAVNRLSVQEVGEYAWIEEIEGAPVLAELGWPADHEGIGMFSAIATELDHRGLIQDRSAMGGLVAMSFLATYKGLVWDTRQAFTRDSKHIDQLVAEWETTSVDFKRELYLDTKDQKAEFVRDVLGLANTQASGRRWLIIGFDDKTRAYHGRPDSKISQNRIETILADYTAPVVEVRYREVGYRAGPVGMLEVIRDSKKLPYKVARELVGEKKRIIAEGQVFVRHGSQNEEPTLAELQAIQEEGDRARAAAVQTNSN